MKNLLECLCCLALTGIHILLGLLILFIAAVLFLFVCSLFVDPKKEYSKHSRFYRCLLNLSTFAALKIMRIKIHPTGMEKIPADTNKMLFVCNHRSNFDPIVTWYALKDHQPAFVSKSSNFKIPIFGRIIRKCCFMAIDRTNPRNAMSTINKAAALLKNGEVSVGIYPEGTRSKTCELLPFHNGVFKIAQKANAPIVVLCITGTEKIYKNYPFRSTDVYLKVLEVIPAHQVKSSKTDTLGEYIKSLMVSHIN